MEDVHTRHCCKYSCKYGDEDCTVAVQGHPPEYPCEHCNCDIFFPNLVQDANKWWDGLTEEEKRFVFTYRNHT